MNIMCILFEEAVHSIYEGLNRVIVGSVGSFSLCGKCVRR